MPFDPSLLEPVKTGFDPSLLEPVKSGFDPSLLEPVEPGPSLQPATATSGLGPPPRQPGYEQAIAAQKVEVPQTPPPPDPLKALLTPFVSLQDKLGVTPEMVAAAPPSFVPWIGKKLGALTPEEAQVLLEPKTPPVTTVDKIAAGTQQGVIGGVESLETPLGVAMLGGAGALPKVAQGVISGVFAVQMAAQIPGDVVETYKAIKRDDPEAAARYAASAVINSAFTVGAGKGMVKGLRPHPEAEAMIKESAPQIETAMKRSAATPPVQPPVAPRPPRVVEDYVEPDPTETVAKGEEITAPPPPEPPAEMTKALQESAATPPVAPEPVAAPEAAAEAANIPLEQAKGKLRALTEQFNRQRTTKSQKAQIIKDAEETRRAILDSGGTSDDIQTATYGTTHAPAAPEAAKEPAAPKPAAETPPAAKGYSNKSRFDWETKNFGEDILSWMADNMRMMSKSEAKKKGADWWSKNGSLYDGAATLDEPHHNVIYRGTSTPDQVADAAFRAGKIKEPTVNALWDEIHDASKGRADNRKTGGAESRYAKQLEGDYNDWVKSTKKAKGGTKVTADELAVGETMEVDGEQVKVVERDDKTGDVILKDGTRFGKQRLAGGQSIWVEKYVEAPEGEATFVPEPKKPDFQLNAPESVADQKARLAKEGETEAEKQRKAKVAELAAKPLSGGVGDIYQGDMLGGNELFNRPTPAAAPAKAETKPPAAPAATKVEEITRRTQGEADFQVKEMMRLDPKMSEDDAWGVLATLSFDEWKKGFDTRPAAPAAEGKRPGIGQGSGARTYQPSGRPEAPESYEGTGLKHAIDMLERAGYGFAERTKLEQHDMVQAMVRAGKTLSDNPLAGRNLVKKLVDDPNRALSGDENALILRHKVTLENAINDAADKSFSEEEGVRIEGDLEGARARSDLNELMDAVARRGSSAGLEMRWRQAIMYEDYSFATQERLSSAAKGRPLTDKERTELLEKIKKITDQNAEYEAHRKKAEAEATELRGKLALEAIEKENLRKQIPAFDKRILAAAESIVSKMKVAGDSALARIKARRAEGRSYATVTIIPPEDIADYAIWGGAKILEHSLSLAKFTDEVVREFGPEFSKHVQQIWDASQKLIDNIKAPDPIKRAIKKKSTDAEVQTDLTERIKSKLKDKRLDQITPLVDKLARTFSDQGVRGWRALGDAVHGVLKEIIPGLDYRDTLDAISGHGKFRIPNQEEGAAALRDSKSQMNEIRKIQEVIARQPVQATGLRRDLPSDVKRRLTQIYENAKRRFGFTVTDPSTQLRSALQARKTYYQHRLSDLQAEIDARKRVVKTKAPSPTDPELEKLVSEYKQVKAAHDEVFAKPELTDAQRADLESKSLDRQITELERQKKTGEIFPPGKTPAFRAAANESKRANLEALKAERDYLRESSQPTSHLTEDEKRLNAMKAGLLRQRANLQDRMARGDFYPAKKKAPVPFDKEGMRLKAGVEALKLDVKRARVRDELSRQGRAAKTADLIARWKRSAVLMWPTILGKLTTAAAEGMMIEPTEGVISGGISKILPRVITDKAMRYGRGTSLHAEVEAISDTVKNFVLNFKSASKTGNMSLDLAYGKPMVMPEYMSEWAGNLHYALKTPLMQNAWSRSFRILMDRNAENGVDVTDAAVIQRIGNQAYKLAEERLFMEPNMVTEAFQRALSRFSEPNKLTGKPTFFGKAAATTIRFEVPIVKIPTNIVKRAFEYTFGHWVGGARIVRGLWNGLENMPEGEQDLIIRNLTRGTLGTAFLLYGYFNHAQFGGYYQPGQKRDKDAIKYGGARIGGVDIPRIALHHPLLEQLQIGATVWNVQNKLMKKNENEASALSKGAWAALMGLTEEAPFAGEIKRSVEKLPRPAIFFGEAAKSTIPGFIQWIAARTDLDKSTGNVITADPTRRVPKTFTQEVEMGVPGLRQNVPQPKTSNVRR